MTHPEEAKKGAEEERAQFGYIPKYIEDYDSAQSSQHDKTLKSRLHAEGRL